MSQNELEYVPGGLLVWLVEVPLEIESPAESIFHKQEALISKPLTSKFGTSNLQQNSPSGESNKQQPPRLPHPKLDPKKRLRLESVLNHDIGMFRILIGVSNIPLYWSNPKKVLNLQERYITFFLGPDQKKGYIRDSRYIYIYVPKSPDQTSQFHCPNCCGSFHASRCWDDAPGRESVAK